MCAFANDCEVVAVISVKNIFKKAHVIDQMTRVCSSWTTVQSKILLVFNNASFHSEVLYHAAVGTAAVNSTAFAFYTLCKSSVQCLCRRFSNATL